MDTILRLPCDRVEVDASDSSLFEGFPLAFEVESVKALTMRSETHQTVSACVSILPCPVRASVRVAIATWMPEVTPSPSRHADDESEKYAQ